MVCYGETDVQLPVEELTGDFAGGRHRPCGAGDHFPKLVDESVVRARIDALVVWANGHASECGGDCGQEQIADAFPALGPIPKPINISDVERPPHDRRSNPRKFSGSFRPTAMGAISGRARAAGPSISPIFGRSHRPPMSWAIMAFCCRPGRAARIP